MISPERKRELAMQIAMFLDDAHDFPSELTDAEMTFVEGLLDVQEQLLVDSQLKSDALADVKHRSPASAAAAIELGVFYRRPPETGIDPDSSDFCKNQSDDAGTATDHGADTTQGGTKPET
jgi:hypothetical protein